MNSPLQLRQCAKYVANKTHTSELTIQNYITTDNLLQNKAGMIPAVSLPAQDGNVTAYKAGDILIANIRPYLKKLWYATQAGGCSADVLAIRASSNVNSKFLYYALFRDDFFIHVMNGSKGTKMPRGDKTQIMDFLIPSFEAEKQKQIAAALSALDKKIELNNRINAELEAMAKTLYDYWFVQFDFPDDSPQGQGKPYKTSGGKMVYNPTLKREIPEGWSDGTLGEIAELYQPKTISEKEMAEDGEFLVYGANGIVGRYDQYNHEQSVVAVTCRGNSCGEINVTRPYSWITGNAMVVNTDSHFLPPTYIYNLLRSSGLENVITGSAQPQITRTNLAPMKIIKPAEKLLISFALLVKPSFEKRMAILDENEKLEKLRDWLLPMLMNGQVTVI